MLNQKEVIALLSKDIQNIPQHIVYQILAAYVYSKASRGNLPAEVLSKVISIQRKLSLQTSHNFPSSSPIPRAFEAIKTALLAANRKWLSLGPLAFGPLGQIGAASSDDAKWAWTKATDGRVKEFSDNPLLGHPEVDAGRVVGPSHPWLAAGNLPGGEGEEEGVTYDGPPTYVPPTPNEGEPGRSLGENGTGTRTGRTEEEEAMEQARLKLAQLREQRLRAEQEEDERERVLEIERREREEAIANAAQETEAGSRTVAT